MLNLFLVFLKLGTCVFGGGYAAIPLMKSEIVDHLGWLTNDAFLNAIAVGQVTPGPVAISATFIGYRVGGLGGALAATAGMFLPSFLIMLLLSAFYCRYCREQDLKSFSRVVLPVVIGLLLAVLLDLGVPAFPSLTAWAIGGAAFLLTLWGKVDYSLTVILSGFAGFMMLK
ncbi:MAG: chromate transporter [bacterium]